MKFIFTNVRIWIFKRDFEALFFLPYSSGTYFPPFNFYVKKNFIFKIVSFLWKRSTQNSYLREGKYNEKKWDSHVQWSFGRKTADQMVCIRRDSLYDVRSAVLYKACPKNISGIQSSLVWTNSTPDSSCCNGRCSLIGNLIWRSARKLLCLSR